MEKITDRLLSWASILEWNTREQALKTASMPFIHPYLALMPDAHLGKGATVGSVIPTMGAIIPAAVGVDIGCGMVAWRTDVRKDDLSGRNLAVLREGIEAVIPLSKGVYNQGLYRGSARKRVDELERLAGAESADKVSPNWPMQLGSLGGGNHFVEVTVDEEGWVWLFLHSGSRGVGNRLANVHIKAAKEACKREHARLPDPDLAYLSEGTQEFGDYIRDLRWAQRFAWLNRDEMIDRLADCFGEWLGERFTVTERVNCHHNYTELEVHGGLEVWLSRKGAIDASLGCPGLIPGSMGTASYVVEGKGNKEALNSSPHGAGRVYSRSSAKKTFTHEDLRAAMKGIEWRDSVAFLDEIPGAYKDIDVVMADAADLVTIRHELHQIVNVKGE